MIQSFLMLFEMNFREKKLEHLLRNVNFSEQRI